MKPHLSAVDLDCGAIYAGRVARKDCVIRVVGPRNASNLTLALKRRKTGA